MSVIDIRNIGGLYPSTLPRNLPDNGAQEAHNLLPNTTEFRPLGADTTVATTGISDPQTLYRFARVPGGALSTDDTTGWTVAAGVRHYVKGPLNDDDTERTYYTGDGVPKVTDLTGAVRQLGVPAPTAAPTVLLNEVYSFTQEQLEIERDAVRQQMIDAVEDTGITRVYHGLLSDTPLVGWVSRDNVSSLAAEVAAARVFAVNPSTNELIDTYSDMTPDEAGWIFDPALRGFYGTVAPGVTLPAWMSSHSKWWCIPVVAYAQVIDIDGVALKAALMAIDMPGTQGATKLFTDAQAQVYVDKFTAVMDKDGETLKPLLDIFKDKHREIDALFNNGGKDSLVAAMADFYAKADVAAAIENAKNVFAEALWIHFRSIGTAVADWDPGITP